jgi:hypothetical protein
MITDNDPVISKYISTPRELSSLNAGAFVAGIVEAILDASQCVRYLKRFFAMILFRNSSRFTLLHFLNMCILRSLIFTAC